jgi:hypothetical protein
MRMTTFLAAGLACLITFAGARAAEIESPPRGSPLRTELLDAVRPAFEEQVGAPVEFVVHDLNVMGDWAYGNVRLQRPGGAEIDWSATKFAEDVKQGMFDAENNVFLLQREGEAWNLVELALGPTDVAWDWWRQQHNLPYELFGADPADFAQ